MEWCLTRESFIPFQNIYKKNITTQTYLPKIKPIFNLKDLNLKDNEEFQKFFRGLCDETLKEQ